MQVCSRPRLMYTASQPSTTDGTPLSRPMCRSLRHALFRPLCVPTTMWTTTRVYATPSLSPSAPSPTASVPCPATLTLSSTGPATAPGIRSSTTRVPISYLRRQARFLTILQEALTRLPICPSAPPTMPTSAPTAPPAAAGVPGVPWPTRVSRRVVATSLCL